MLDAIFAPLRNALAVWGARKADDKIDGREPGKKLLEESIKNLGEKKGREIIEGPGTNFLLEVIEGMNEKNKDFVGEMMQWLVFLKKKKESSSNRKIR